MIQYKGMILDGPMAGQFVESESGVCTYTEFTDDQPFVPSTGPDDVRQHVLKAFVAPFVDYDGQRNSVCFFIDDEAAGRRPWLHVFTRLAALAEERTKIQKKLKKDWGMTITEFLER